MREYTWLDRPISWSNLRVFEGVLDRLGLAAAWVTHAGVEVPRPRGRARGRGEEHAGRWIDWVASNRTFARAAADREAAFLHWCDAMIGGRTPEEALVEFGRVARIHEAEAAELVHGREGLDQVSRREGRDAGKRNGYAGGLRVPSGAIPSIRSCAIELQQSALGWLDWPSQERPLVERDIPGRLDWVLEECPHQDLVLKGRTSCDFLCAQHLEWFRGFCESIDRRLVLEERSREPLLERCRIALAWSVEGRA